jgi:hypothetical protein
VSEGGNPPAIGVRPRPRAPPPLVSRSGAVTSPAAGRLNR